MGSNFRLRQHGFAPVILIAFTLLVFACAADNMPEQELASAVEPAPTVANQDASIVAEADNAAQESTLGTTEVFTVDCGQVNDAGEKFCYVDGDTYIGWRTYHGFCHVCHAQDAVGSTFAPSLVDRMQESDMNKDLFVKRMNDGFTGQMGVMPGWKENPNVSKRYNELYAYLMARASGELSPGRPKKKPKSN